MASVWIRKATEHQPNVDADDFIRGYYRKWGIPFLYGVCFVASHCRQVWKQSKDETWMKLWKERWLVPHPSQDATELHIRAFSSTEKSQTAVQLFSRVFLCSHEGRLHPPSCSSALTPPLPAQNTPPRATAELLLPLSSTCWTTLTWRYLKHPPLLGNNPETSRLLLISETSSSVFDQICSKWAHFNLNKNRCVCWILHHFTFHSDFWDNLPPPDS